MLVGGGFDVQRGGEQREPTGAGVAAAGLRGLHCEGAGRVVEVLEHQEVLRLAHKRRLEHAVEGGDACRFGSTHLSATSSSTVVVVMDVVVAATVFLLTAALGGGKHLGHLGGTDAVPGQTGRPRHTHTAASGALVDLLPICAGQSLEALVQTGIAHH